MSKPEVPPYTEMPGYLIRRAQQISTAAFHDRMQREGLDVTPFQFAALSAIAQNPGVDQATVATETAVDRATMGGVIERLVEKGLVSREVSKQDRRARVLHLTVEGAMRLSSIRRIVGEISDDITTGLSPEEARQLVRLLQKITIERPAG